MKKAWQWDYNESYKRYECMSCKNYTIIMYKLATTWKIDLYKKEHILYALFPKEITTIDQAKEHARCLVKKTLSNLFKQQRDLYLETLAKL